MGSRLRGDVILSRCNADTFEKLKTSLFFVVSFVKGMVNLTEYFFSRLLKETVANFPLNVTAIWSV